LPPGAPVQEQGARQNIVRGLVLKEAALYKHISGVAGMTAFMITKLMQKKAIFFLRDKCKCLLPITQPLKAILCN